MINARRVLVMSVGASLAVLLAACSSDSDVQTASSASTTSVEGFVTAYNQGLASPQAMNSATFTDLFDEGFLDAGYNKAQVLENIKQDVANAASIEADSTFPALSIKDAAITGCDDNSGVCTLTATYVNPAPDGSTATTAVPVRFKDGKFRLYGDQKNAS